MKLSGNQKAFKRVCGKCAGIHREKETDRRQASLAATSSACRSVLLHYSPFFWIKISNQMNALKQSKQSAFLSIFISCFHLFPAFFKLINFFIYYLKSGQSIFINKFKKAMKEKMKLESRPDTLIHAISYRAILTRGKRSEASRQAGLAVPLSARKSLSVKIKSGFRKFCLTKTNYFSENWSMTTKNDTVQLSVRFEPAVHKKIQAMAKKEHRTLNSYVNYVVINSLKKGENEPA